MRHEADETFALTLTAPVGATLGASRSIATIRNDDDAPELWISAAEGREGGRRDDATDLRGKAFGGFSDLPVTVDFSTSGSTATVGSDFSARTGILTFAPGEPTKTVDIAIKGDTTFEPNETFIVRLANASGATISAAAATGTILNDDVLPPPVLAVAAATARKSEGNSGKRHSPSPCPVPATPRAPAVSAIGWPARAPIRPVLATSSAAFCRPAY